ncbi:MAG TPA: hypothetical protein VKP66_07770 [Steroidobacteraceae bacterium]|nr:hypothetical protein [Steroidobacteraceae bacterium]
MPPASFNVDPRPFPPPFERGSDADAEFGASAALERFVAAEVAVAAFISTFNF